jgi:hypothetical protein
MGLRSNQTVKQGVLFSLFLSIFRNTGGPKNFTTPNFEGNFKTQNATTFKDSMPF